jgi:hypothetical protein
MSASLTSLVRSTLLVLTLIASCLAQETPALPKISTSAHTRPDDGSISGNVYSNKFFDFTFEFPKDWIPHGEATNKRLEELGNEKLKDSGGGSGLALGKDIYHLLTVFENEVGTPGVTFFRSEVLQAEDISWAPGIKTGKDFLLDGAPTLKRMGYQTFSEITPIEIGGVTFYREDASRRVNAEITSYQIFFCTVLRRHALSLAITTEEAEATRKLADDISFRFGKDAELAANAPADIAPSPREAGSRLPANPQETGSIEAGIYRNSYFGLTYHLPKEWYVDTRIFKERLAESSDDPAKGTFVLLSANEFAPGTPGLKFNPDMALMAINASAYHKVFNTGNDYLTQVRPGMVNILHDQLLEQGAVISVGGREFYRADYKRPVGYQTIVCTVWQGYVLVWTFVGQTKAQLDELVKSMQSISVEKP